VIVHKPTHDWEDSEDNPIYDHVKSARLRQNMEIPLDKCIRYATWPETTLYFSTLSMDSHYMTEDMSTLYQHTFQQYIDEWDTADTEEQPAPIDSPTDLTEYQRDRLDDIRFGIKKDRDKYFAEHTYDDLEITSVPKEFWLTPYEQDREQDSMDDFTRSALDNVNEN